MKRNSVQGCSRSESIVPERNKEKKIRMQPTLNSSPLPQSSKTVTHRELTQSRTNSKTLSDAKPT